MRTFVRTMVFACFVGVPGFAAAQGSQVSSLPQPASSAFAIDIGALKPQSSQLGGSLLMNLGYEYYLTPNLSWRTSFGWANPEFRGPGIDTVRQVPLRVDVNYTWPIGGVSPFASAGLGVYLLQFRNNGLRQGDTEAEPGINIGGGVESFLNRTVSWKGEVRYQAVGNARGVDTSGLALTVGLKTYF